MERIKDGSPVVSEQNQIQDQLDQLGSAKAEVSAQQAGLSSGLSSDLSASAQV